MIAQLLNSFGGTCSQEKVVCWHDDLKVLLQPPPETNRYAGSNIVKVTNYRIKYLREIRHEVCHRLVDPGREAWVEFFDVLSNNREHPTAKLLIRRIRRFVSMNHEFQREEGTNLRSLVKRLLNHFFLFFHPFQ